MSLKDVHSSISSSLYRQVGRAKSRVQEYRSLPVDVLEDEVSYLVVFDAPGVESEDVQVRYVDGDVRIRVDRFRSYREGFEMRFPGRGLALGGDAELPADALVDPDAATARLTEVGTLNIEIPKDERPEGDGQERDVEDAEEIALDD